MASEKEFYQASAARSMAELGVRGQELEGQRRQLADAELALSKVWKLFGVYFASISLSLSLSLSLCMAGVELNWGEKGDLHGNKPRFLGAAIWDWGKRVPGWICLSWSGPVPPPRLAALASAGCIYKVLAFVLQTRF